VTQLSLLGRVERDERPRKTVRKVSREQYAVLRDTPGLLPAKRAAVLRNIAAIFNARQAWPTTAEVVAWMFERGELQRPSANLISGRITELVGGGVCAFGPLRPCDISGRQAHGIRVVQR